MNIPPVAWGNQPISAKKAPRVGSLSYSCRFSTPSRRTLSQPPSIDNNRVGGLQLVFPIASDNQCGVEPTSSTYPQPTPAGGKGKEDFKKERKKLIEKARNLRKVLAKGDGNPNRMLTIDEVRNFLIKEGFDVSMLDAKEICNFKREANEKLKAEQLNNPEYQKFLNRRPELVEKAKIDKNKLAKESGDPDRMYTDADAKKLLAKNKIDIIKFSTWKIANFTRSVNTEQNDPFLNRRAELVEKAKVDKNKLAKESGNPNRMYTDADTKKFLTKNGIDITKLIQHQITNFTRSVNTKQNDPEYQEFSDRLPELIEKAKVNKNKLAKESGDPNRMYTIANTKELLEKNKIDITKVGDSQINYFTQIVNQKSKTEKLKNPEYQEFCNRRLELVEEAIADKNKRAKDSGNPNRRYTYDNVRTSLMSQGINIIILDITDIRLFAKIVNRSTKNPKQVSGDVRKRAGEIRRRNLPPRAPELMLIKQKMIEQEDVKKYGGKITVFKLGFSNTTLELAEDIKRKIEAEVESLAAAEVATQANAAVEAAIEAAVWMKDVVEVEGELEGAVEARVAIEAVIEAAAQAKLKADDKANAEAAAAAAVEAAVEAAAEAAPTVRAIAAFMPKIELEMKNKVKAAMEIAIEAVVDAKRKAGEAAEAEAKLKRINQITRGLRKLVVRQIEEPWGPTDTLQGKEAADIRITQYAASKEVREAKRNVMKLEDEFVRDLFEQINSVREGEQQRGNNSKYSWNPLNKEGIVEREIILSNLRKLRPDGLLQRCQNFNLLRAILTVRDQEMFDIFIRNITDAVRILQSVGKSDQANQQVRNLFDDSCMEQMKQIGRDWSDEALSPLISAMVHMANTAVSVQNILDLLKGGTKDPNTKHATILNNLKNKLLENRIVSNEFSNFNRQIVIFLDQSIAHLETILDAKDDTAHQKLKNQLLIVNILFDEKLNRIKSTVSDADLFKIAKKLKTVTNSIYKTRPSVIEPKIIAKTLNIIRARMRDEALQGSLVDNQIKYLPKIGVAWFMEHIRKNSALPDPVKWAFIAGLPESTQQEVYERQPSWRPNLNEEGMDGIEEEIAKAFDLVMEKQGKQRKRKKQEELREQARYNLLPQTNAIILEASLSSRRKYPLPKEFDEVKMSQALALLEKKKLLLQSENRKEVADVVDEIESAVSGLEAYGLERFGDGTAEGTSFALVLEVLTRRSRDDLKKQLEDYQEYYSILKCRIEELPAEEPSDSLPRAKRQKLDEYHPMLKRRIGELATEEPSDSLPPDKRQKLGECIERLEDIIAKKNPSRAADDPARGARQEKFDEKKIVTTSAMQFTTASEPELNGEEINAAFQENVAFQNEIAEFLDSVMENQKKQWGVSKTESVK